MKTKKIERESKSLLEKAKSKKIIPQKTHMFSKEETDLAMAYANGEITMAQVMHAKGIKGGACFYFLALALAEIIRNNQ